MKRSRGADKERKVIREEERRFSLRDTDRRTTALLLASRVAQLRHSLSPLFSFSRLSTERERTPIEDKKEREKMNKRDKKEERGKKTKSRR